MKRVVLPSLYVLLCFSLFLAHSGCKKKPPPLAAPTSQRTASPTDIPAKPKIAPTVEISALPSTVERGKESTLSWQSTNATAVLIDQGVGNVAEGGTLVISPRESTTFTATATGPGGSDSNSTRVTVVAAKGPGILRSTDIDQLQSVIDQGKVQPIFFAYDQAELSAESKKTLQENASWIGRFPGASVTIEGHCDERGTEEYNLALGDRRAQATRDYLVRLGIDATRLKAISFGEERPFDPGHDEAAWARNRRAHFVAQR